MEVKHVDSSTYDVGDVVRYYNHLREYQGKECNGVVIDIIQIQKDGFEEYYIINDNHRIRSVHVSQIISYR